MAMDDWSPPNESTSEPVKMTESILDDVIMQDTPSSLSTSPVLTENVESTAIPEQVVPTLKKRTAGARPAPVAPKPVAAPKPAAPPKADPAQEASGWWRQNATAATPVSQEPPVPVNVNNQSLLSASGDLWMFWLDATEGNNGLIYLFGKVRCVLVVCADDKVMGDKGPVSACVTVEGMERVVHVLPRTRVVDCLSFYLIANQISFWL
jgi:hypothetical protein